MALNKKFSAMDGLDFSTTPVKTEEKKPKQTKPKQTETSVSKPKQAKNSKRFNKEAIKKKEVKSIRKQFLIRSSDNKKIEEECKRLEISQNEFINLLIKRYFE